MSFEEYGDLHRATLQMLLGRGTIEKTLFGKIFENLAARYAPDEPIQRNTINDVIDLINEQIKPFDQKIIHYKYPLNGSQYYILYSSAKTSMSKFQNLYNEAEVEYFKVMVMKMTENERLCTSPREALNISFSIVGKLTKIRAQFLIDSWISSGYFCKHTDDMIYFGPKILIEFQDLLQGLELPHIRSCLLCEKIAIWGDRCGSCNTIYHSDCILKFLSRSESCPSCKEKWETTRAGGGSQRPEDSDNDD